MIFGFKSRGIKAEIQALKPDFFKFSIIFTIVLFVFKMFFRGHYFSTKKVLKIYLKQ